MPDRPRVDLVCNEPSPAAQALALLVAELGASVSLVTPTAVRPDRQRTAAIVLDGVDPDVLAALGHAPTLVVAADEKAVRSIAHGSGIAVGLGQRIRCRDYDFAPNEPVLWPFAGLSVQEEADRELETLLGPAVHPLVTVVGRPVLAAIRGSDMLVTTAVPWPDAAPPYLLRSAMSPRRFLDVLPTLIFVRRALGERAWRRPRAQAIAVIDDPNLARLSYGYLDYQQAARLASDCRFHLSIGFVPLDYSRTDPAVGRFFLENERRLSLVMHGNDHLKREMARAVSDDRASFAMRQGLARMRRHRELTGLACAPIMTMPHGASDPRWVKAMRDAGYSAAMIGRAYSFTDDPQSAGAGRLYELMPAETSLYGFPLVTRWALEYPLTDVLFGAFLGKPSCVYTHHQFFAEGWGPFLNAVSFLNRQLDSRWGPAVEIVQSNYLFRRRGGTLMVRAFSNDLLIEVPDWANHVEVEKLGARIPYETERVLVEGHAVEESERSETRIAASVVPHKPGSLGVQFVSTLAGDPGPGWERVMLTSRARRWITETRDRRASVLFS